MSNISESESLPPPPTQFNSETGEEITGLKVMRAFFDVVILFKETLCSRYQSNYSFLKFQSCCQKL